jgi:hypothetical protein
MKHTKNSLELTKQISNNIEENLYLDEIINENEENDQNLDKGKTTKSIKSASISNTFHSNPISKEKLNHKNKKQTSSALFQYEIKEKLSSLNLHLALLDSYGQVIFSSAPEDCGISKSLDKGKYSANVELPEDLLTSMSYSLKLILWDHVSGSFLHYDVNEEIRLKPIETNSLINKTSGGRSGILAIKCNWKID